MCFQGRRVSQSWRMVSWQWPNTHAHTTRTKPKSRGGEKETQEEGVEALEGGKKERKEKREKEKEEKNENRGKKEAK